MVLIMNVNQGNCSIQEKKVARRSRRPRDAV